MLELLGKILPLALGAAASAMLFAVTVLILASRHPHARMLAFLAGAASPLILLGLVVTVILMKAATVPGFHFSIPPRVEFFFGLFLLLLALGTLIAPKKKTDQSSGDFEATTLGGVHIGRFYGLGVTTALFNPSALALFVVAAVDIDLAEVGTAGKLVAFLLVIVVMLASIEVLFVLDLAAHNAMQRYLQPIGRWARAHSRLIAAILLALIGIFLTVIGLRGL